MCLLFVTFPLCEDLISLKSALRVKLCTGNINALLNFQMSPGILQTSGHREINNLPVLVLVPTDERLLLGGLQATSMVITRFVLGLNDMLIYLYVCVFILTVNMKIFAGYSFTPGEDVS